MSIVGHEFKWINQADTVLSPRVDKILEKYRFLKIQSSNNKKFAVDESVGDDS
jgi:hypothetical protein